MQSLVWLVALLLPFGVTGAAGGVGVVTGLPAQVVGTGKDNTQASAAPLQVERRRLDDAFDFEQVAKLVASDGTSDGYSGDRFGCSVAVDGDRVVVGAYYHDTDGDSNRGAAYVYDMSSSGTLTEVAKLVASDGGRLDYFGVSVAIDGDRVVVGANGHDSDGDYGKGAAYIYDISSSGTMLTEVAKLVPSDGENFDDFGISVAVDGHRVVVGAWEHDTDGDDKRGAAYVYDVLSSGTLTEVAKLVASDGKNGDRFGVSVAIDGDRVVVGAYLHEHDTDGTSSEGAAYVYDVSSSSGTLTEVNKLVASDGAADDRFGYSVAIDGDRVVVGAHLDRYFTWVYDVSSSGTLTEVAKLEQSDGKFSERFGYSVAIDGDRVVVGAYWHNIDGSSQGAAYIYDLSLSGTLLTEVAKLVASDGAAGDNFGYSVAIDGDRVVVGASHHDTDGDFNRGAAYVYDALVPASVPTPSQTTSSPTTSSPTTSSPTLAAGIGCPVLSLLASTECPDELDLPACDDAALIAGSFCVGGDDYCGTSNSADNCGDGYDVYRVVVASTPSATPSPMPRPTPQPTFKPTLSPSAPTSPESQPTLEPTISSKKSSDSSSGGGPDVAVIAGVAAGGVLLIVAILAYCCRSAVTRQGSKEPPHDLEKPSSQSADLEKPSSQSAAATSVFG